ncbi:hypothetical protein WN51_04690 [Melipona quadrifasciata]|uniref:Uncharacterized protein n=1 Tax=Melipona quadrifasciata TaxID=166423 RepID=A0A0M9AAY3_9HYME|nr:hypothetical protein WN51_04690 [Melipona quadrifasciata]
MRMLLFCVGHYIIVSCIECRIPLEITNVVDTNLLALWASCMICPYLYSLVEQLRLHTAIQIHMLASAAGNGG